MHGNVPVRFGRGRLDSLGNKGLAAYLIGYELVAVLLHERFIDDRRASTDQVL